MSEVVWEKPKQSQKWSGKSSGLVREKPEKAQNLSGRRPKRLRNSLVEAPTGAEMDRAEMVREKPAEAQKGILEMVREKPEKQLFEENFPCQGGSEFPLNHQPPEPLTNPKTSPTSPRSARRRRAASRRARAHGLVWFQSVCRGSLRLRVQGFGFRVCLRFARFRRVS